MTGTPLLICRKSCKTNQKSFAALNPPQHGGKMGRNRRGTGAWGKPDTVLQGAYPLRSAPNNRGRMANLMKKQVSLLLAALLLLGVMGGCTQSAPPPTATPTPAQESPSAPPATEIALSKAYIIVQGYEWGPAIPKIVLEFAEDVSGFASDTFEVAFGSTKRTVKDVYSSDEDGNKCGAARNMKVNGGQNVTDNR